MVESFYILPHICNIISDVMSVLFKILIEINVIILLFTHDWCNKGRCMCYPVFGMVHIKEPLLLMEKSSPCGSSRFPLSLSEWSFTICPTPYNRK